MTHDSETVKLKREVAELRYVLNDLRTWLLSSFDDSQDWIEQSHQYLSRINGVLGHENDVHEFLAGSADDDGCSGGISDDAYGTGQSHSGRSARS